MAPMNSPWPWSGPAGTGAASPRPAAPAALRLGERMRERLEAAVRALLDDPALVRLPDVARLAAVVLMAKASVHTSRTSIWAAELARWLGVSESTIDHAALPALRASGALKSRAVTGPDGLVTGLDCVVMPLWRAKRSGDHTQPLALSQKELATLLRLLEALFGPGWAPAGKDATLPGLLAGRRARGAATDRLALLLLTLRSRGNGRVRLVGGRVESGRGRSGATLAGLLGCSVSGASKVLTRLQDLGVVVTRRLRHKAGHFGKTLLLVPAVAAAHGARGGDAPGLVGEASCEVREPSTTDTPSHRRYGPGAVSQRPDTALGGRAGSPGLRSPDASRGSAAPAADRADFTERPAAAPHHTGHSLVGRPKGHPAMENRNRPFVPAGGALPVVGARAKHRASEREVPPTDGSAPVAPPSASGGSRRHPRQVVGTRLYSVLEPVHWLLDQVESGFVLRAIARMVQRELDLGMSEDRLRHRLTERFAGTLVSDIRDPGRWLLGVGLPRWGCGHFTCEAGTMWPRLKPCELCAEVVADRRAEKASGTRPATVIRPATVPLAEAPRCSPRASCTTCGCVIRLVGPALNDGLCKPCRTDGTSGAAAQAPVPPLAPRFCQGWAGKPCPRPALRNRAVCLRHLSRELEKEAGSAHRG